MKLVILFILSFSLAFGVVYTLLKQNDTIEQQRTVIREMMTNPACMVEKAK